MGQTLMLQKMYLRETFVPLEIFYALQIGMKMDSKTLSSLDSSIVADFVGNSEQIFASEETRESNERKTSHYDELFKSFPLSALPLPFSFSPIRDEN